MFSYLLHGIYGYTLVHVLSMVETGIFLLALTFLGRYTYVTLFDSIGFDRSLTLLKSASFDRQIVGIAVRFSLSDADVENPIVIFALTVVRIRRSAQTETAMHVSKSSFLPMHVLVRVLSR